MVLTHEQKRVRDLLTETVTLLCKNGLQFKSEIGIEALIGITLDRDEVFLVSIKETISSNDEVLEDSLVGLDSADRAVDDEEYVAASHMVDYKTGENKNKFVQRRSKVRKGLQSSCDGSDIQMINPDVGDKVLVFASETKDQKHTSETLAQNESVRSLQHSSTSRGSGNMSYSSDIDMKNTFAVASGSCNKPASRIRNEATDSGNFAAESHLSGDSGIIQIKHENAEEQFIPYMELDSLCASSADDLSDLSWRPDHEGSHLLPHNSGDPCFPQRKRRQNSRSRQAYAMVDRMCAEKPVGSSEHQCPICGLVFTNWNVYLRHIREHQPGLYRCPFCGKSFSGSTNLRGHLAVHTNVREFACHLCEKAYAYKRDLIEHMLLKHNQVMSQQSLSTPSDSAEKYLQ